MADRHASGGKLEHILDGASGFMFNTHILHALKFKDEWAITPEQLAELSPHMQDLVKGAGARIKAWSEKEREAYKHKHAGDAEAEEVDDDKPRRGRTPKE